MGWFEIIAVVAIVLYAVFLAGNFSSYSALSGKKLPGNYVPQTGITVIIAARNEEQNILRCLQDIAQQDFDKEKVEVIVVDDASEDQTAALAEKFLLENFIHYKLTKPAAGKKGKKAAIITGVAESMFAVIATRDADTLGAGRNWLKTIAYNFENGDCDLLISPVLINKGNTFFAAFENYENLAITFLGRAMAHKQLPFVCSGANLAYRKVFFEDLQPYQNNLSTPSGDDMFLLKRARKTNALIQPNLLKGSEVFIEPQQGGALVLAQRLRWAAKTGKILTGSVIFSGLTLLFGNLAGLCAMALLFIDTRYLPFCLFTLIIKLLIDFLLLLLSSTMFGKKLNLVWFLPAFVFNLVYTPVISLLSVFVPIKWKGRKV